MNSISTKDNLIGINKSFEISGDFYGKEFNFLSIMVNKC